MKNSTLLTLLLRIALPICWALAIPASTLAQATWTGSSNTNWNNALNWSTSAVPGNTINVTIPGGLTNYPVVSSGGLQVKNITINSSGSGATLTIATGGSLTSSGTVTVDANGTFAVTGGTFSSSTTITVNASGILTASSGTLSNSGAISISGTMTASGSAVNATGTLTINVGGTLTVSGSTISASKPVSDNGTLNVSSGSLSTASGQGISGNGNFAMSGGTVTVGTASTGGSDFNLHGTVDLSGGLLEIGHDFDLQSASGQTATGGTVEFMGVAGGAPFATGTYQFYNVQIDPGANPGFDNQNNTIIDVAGNWTNNSTATLLTQKTTTVVFNGSSAQTIGGTASTTFYNMTVSNTSGNVTLSSNTNVYEKLSFTSGSIDASNASLTILANNTTNPSTATAIAGVSSNSYIIVGNGVTTTGSLTIDSIPASTSTVFPIGTSSYYLPATINPGANTKNTYSAFVFQGITTNALENGPAFGASALQQVVNGVWSISRSAGSGTSSLTLNWSSAGTALEGSLFQGYGLNIGMSQYTGGAWQTTTGSGNEATHTATASFSSFTQFGVGGSSVVLALSVDNFNAVLQNQSVKLTWTLLDAVNIISSSLERSSDGINWVKIFSVTPQENLLGDNNYVYTDENPTQGVNYYRLLVQSAPGNITYSEIKSVIFRRTVDLIIFPNPARDFINISYAVQDPKILIRLISPTGQLIAFANSAVTTGAVLRFNIASLSSGVYTIQVLSSNAVLQTSHFVIYH